MTSAEQLLRPDLRKLVAYDVLSPPSDWTRLHANESPDTDALEYNRYPDRQPPALRQAMADHYQVEPDELLITRGSDDAIDLLCRAFLRPGKDSALIPEPGFSVYSLSARIQGAAVRQYPAQDDYANDLDLLLEAAASSCRLVFMCSPNNPTGSLWQGDHIRAACRHFEGDAMVVVDEAYLEFCQQPSAARLLGEHDNLVVLRTLSKAHGCAGLRVGSLLANSKTIELLDPLVPAYPLAQPVIDLALTALSLPRQEQTRRRLEKLRAAKQVLAERLAHSDAVRDLWAGAANFLLVQPCDLSRFRNALERHRVLVRGFGKDSQLTGMLRITIGDTRDNARLLDALELAESQIPAAENG